MHRLRRITVLAIAGALIACTPNAGEQHAAPAPSHAPLTNPSGFPLVPGARIVDVKPFQQTISNTANDRSSWLSSQGAGTYEGHEMLAVTGASASSLRAWLNASVQKPPAGFAPLESAGAANRFGVNFAVFNDVSASKGHSVVVVVMDPAQVKDKLGGGLDLIERYRSLPEFLRQPVDNELKQRFGISGTEATDPSSPLGMTLSALQTIQSGNDRAILVVDAAKH
jgi:hypothetical protein